MISYEKLGPLAFSFGFGFSSALMSAGFWAGVPNIHGLCGGGGG